MSHRRKERRKRRGGERREGRGKTAKGAEGGRVLVEHARRIGGWGGGEVEADAAEGDKKHVFSWQTARNDGSWGSGSVFFFLFLSFTLSSFV